MSHGRFPTPIQPPTTPAFPEVQIRGPLAALTLSKAVSRGLTQLRGLVLLTRLVAQREGVHVAMKLLELLSGYRDSLDKDDTRNSDGELLCEWSQGPALLAGGGGLPGGGGEGGSESSGVLHTTPEWDPCAL